MNERYLKARLARELRTRLPKAIVYRHEDKFTAGIPDFSVSLDGVTIWAEVKYDPRGRQSRLTKIQEIAVKKTHALVVRYAALKPGKTLTVVMRADGTPHKVFGKHFNHAMVVNEIERALATEYSMVRDFHLRFGLATPSRPLAYWPGVNVRQKHLDEEVREAWRACNKLDLPEMADALADIVYVALGTAIQLGLPWREIFRRVHEANMCKARCSTLQSKEGIYKPAGWVPPDVCGALRDAGWREDDR